MQQKTANPGRQTTSNNSNTIKKAGSNFTQKSTQLTALQIIQMQTVIKNRDDDENERVKKVACMHVPVLKIAAYDIIREHYRIVGTTSNKLMQVATAKVWPSA